MTCDLAAEPASEGETRPAEALPPPAPPPNAAANPSMKPMSYQLPLFWTS